MEKALGIICEYNPFHAGHARQLSEARARFGEKPIVLLLSGNFVQRAEAAVCDVYRRAVAALSAGADLVLLLPFPYSTLGAQGYARSAVSVLHRLGAVDTLVFGAEEEKTASLHAVADALASEEFEALFSAALSADARASYAHLRAETLGKLVPDAPKLLKKPNNILAVEYLAAIRRGNFDLFPVVLPRSAEPSATALRARLAAGEALSTDDVPSEALLDALNGADLPQNKLEEILLCALRAGLSCPELSVLGARVENHARRARNFSEFVVSTKTRKITSARVRRGVLHAYFGVEEGELPEVPYTVLLGANEKGRAVLSFIYNKGQIPVFTKPSAPLKATGDLLKIGKLQAKADSVYAALLGKEGDFFLKQGPKIVNKL